MLSYFWCFLVFTVVSDFYDYCCSSLTNENTLANEMRKHFTKEASTKKCSSNFCLVVRQANGFKPLNIITKHSILDVVAALDPSLVAFIKLI